MAFKLGGKKPQMNNASSMKASAAMYASKTSMYGKKPMMNGEDGPRKPTKLENLDVLEGMQKMANDRSRGKATRDVGNRPVDLTGQDQNLSEEFLTDLQKRKEGFRNTAKNVGIQAGREYASNKGSRGAGSRPDITASKVAERKMSEVAKSAGASSSDFPVLTKQLGEESASYARGEASRIKKAKEAKKKQAAKTKPSMYGKKKKK